MVLDRLRNTNSRSESRLRFQSEAVAEKKRASKKAKAKKDLRRAKRAAELKAAKLKARARADARRAGERARERVAEAGRTPGNVDAPQSTREVFELAGQSAQLRSPVDATIDPSPDGPAVESMATTMASPMDDRDRPDDGAGAMVPASFVAGAAVDAGSAGEDAGGLTADNPLEFDDPLVFGGED
jgi:hypothetical protein